MNLAAVALAVAVLAPGQSAAPPADSVAARDLPVSLGRIRNALKRPPPLIITAHTEATFKVEINERQHFQDLLDLIDFGSGPVAPGGLYGYQQQQILGQKTQPLFNVSLSGVGQSINSAVVKARRERAEHLAREEVRRALVDFCAANDCQVR